MSVQRLDWLLIVPLVVSFLMIAEFDTVREGALTLSGWAKLAILGLATLVLSPVVAAASALDRRCSEEYTFQMMANAALVAIGATMLVNLVWAIGERAFDLPELASDNILGVTLLAWVLGYYWFRVKGTAH